MKTLTPAQRSALRARAHRLHPVAVIGQKGLTPSLLEEIGRCLDAHELIKVRVFGEERDGREAMLGEICAAVDAAPVQHIGNILIIFREKPAEEPAQPETVREARRLPRKPSLAPTRPTTRTTVPRRRLAAKQR